MTYIRDDCIAHTYHTKYGLRTSKNLPRADSCLVFTHFALGVATVGM
jgi:hypothetical protein